MVTTPALTRMIKMPEVASRSARGKSTIYADIGRGLFPKPIKIGKKSSIWPESEVETIIRARIAAKTDDEIRALVVQLEHARSER